jgi:hypothetical protein
VTPIMPWGYLMNVQNDIANASVSLTWIPTSSPPS